MSTKYGILADITYMPTKEGWLYLTGMMNLYGRKLVCWVMDSHMKTELISTALKQAIGRTGTKEGLLVHSDRRVQYAVGSIKSYKKNVDLSVV